MKYSVLAILTGLSLNVFAATRIQCEIESPCLWAKDNVNSAGEALGYCVNELAGDQAALNLVKSDITGLALGSIELPIVENSDEKISAASSDGAVSLKTRKYNDYFAGNLRIKSSAGLFGFFVTCIKK